MHTTDAIRHGARGSGHACSIDNTQGILTSFLWGLTNPETFI
jgi:hypothetical protein